MSPTSRDTVTRLLAEVAAGRGSARDELFEVVYGELRSLASAYFQNERKAHTLQPTALVHEAFLRLVDQHDARWQSRNQFFALAARAMRNILVDHARGRNRLKRGGDRRQVQLDAAELAAGAGADGPDLEALDQALEGLAGLDERKARLVELRFFAGLTSEQAAEVLGISRTTASEEWRMARAWLHRELKQADAER